MSRLPDIKTICGGWHPQRTLAYTGQVWGIGVGKETFQGLIRFIGGKLLATQGLKMEYMVVW